MRLEFTLANWKLKIHLSKDKAMVIKNSEMKTQVRHELKGGNGDIHFLNYADCSEFKNCRLLSEMTIPVNASIGEHTHIAETEYYIVLSGKGLVVDNGSEKVVEDGDLIVTNGGETHEIKNIGSVPLKIIAIIVTY